MRELRPEKKLTCPEWLSKSMAGLSIDPNASDCKVYVLPTAGIELLTSVSSTKSSHQLGPHLPPSWVSDWPDGISEHQQSEKEDRRAEINKYKIISLDRIMIEVRKTLLINLWSNTLHYVLLDKSTPYHLRMGNLTLSEHNLSIWKISNSTNNLTPCLLNKQLM